MVMVVYKKLGLFSGMLFLILLCGCSNHEDSQVRQPEYIEMYQVFGYDEK